MSRKREYNYIEVDRRVAYVYFRGKEEGRCVIIDSSNVEKIKNYLWFDNGQGYATTKVYKNNKTTYIKMHRLIMSNDDSGIMVDHINHLRMDNREKNLRLCIDGEPHNLSNRKLDFYFPEIVDIYRNPVLKYFTLKVSNGLYNDVQFNYANFGFLLDDRSFLYNHGLDSGLTLLIEHHKNHILKEIKEVSKESKQYQKSVEQLNYLDSKIAEARINVSEEVQHEHDRKLIENGLEKSKMKRDTPYYLKDGKTVIISSLGMTSKKKINTDLQKIKFYNKLQDE